jgi:hypothetical protein
MMSDGKKVFGKPISLSGLAGAFPATAVPVGMLSAMIQRPIPATYTSTTFVIAATATNPVFVKVGNDLAKLEETKTYTWTAGTTNTILSSAGVVTASQAPVTGGWYFYLGIQASDGALLLYPSQTAPNENSLNHPGTSKTIDWGYVGYQICSSITTPAFVSMTKQGKRLQFAALTIGSATTWAEGAWTGAKALPKTGALGTTVGGHVNTGAGADATIVVGSTSDNTLGVVKAEVAGTTTSDSFFPLPPMVPTANGKLYLQHTVAAGDVNITWIDDIV